MVSAKSAQQFVDELGGEKEVVETDAGVFRRSDVTGDGYRVFTLSSLLPKMNFEVHITKMKDRPQMRGQMRGEMKDRLDVHPLPRFWVE